MCVCVIAVVVVLCEFRGVPCVLIFVFCFFVNVLLFFNNYFILFYFCLFVCLFVSKS